MQDDAQPTEPHQSGQVLFINFLKTCLTDSRGGGDPRGSETLPVLVGGRASAPGKLGRVHRAFVGWFLQEPMNYLRKIKSQQKNNTRSTGNWCFALSYKAAGPAECKACWVDSLAHPKQRGSHPQPTGRERLRRAVECSSTPSRKCTQSIMRLSCDPASHWIYRVAPDN